MTLKKLLLLFLLLSPLSYGSTDNSNHLGLIYEPEDLIWILDYKNYSHIRFLPIHYEIKVAVIDTGIDSSHPDFPEDFMVAGYNTVGTRNDGPVSTEPEDLEDISESDGGHGTPVAGLIVSNQPNGIGPFMGMNPSAKIVNIRWLNEGSSSYSDYPKAFELAIEEDVDIINFSNAMTANNWDNYRINEIFPEIDNNGIIMVAGAGNRVLDIPVYPANEPTVFGIGMIEIDDSLKGDPGEQVSFVAPGWLIRSLSRTSDYDYAYASGTSLSTPVVSGIISRLLAYDNTLTRDDIESLLINNSDPVNEEGYGYGLINVETLVNEMGINVETKTIESQDGQGNPIYLVFEIGFDTNDNNSETGRILKYIYDSNGTRFSVHKEF